jgi:hypothetical protein
VAATAEAMEAGATAGAGTAEAAAAIRLLLHGTDRVRNLA